MIGINYKSDKIVKFLKSHPAIAVAIIEKESKVRPLTIAHAMQGSRNIPKRHIDKIEKELKKYGYK